MYYRILRIILAVAVASPLGAALPAAAQQQPQQQQNQQGGMPGMDHSRMGDHSAMGPGIGQQMMQQQNMLAQVHQQQMYMHNQAQQQQYVYSPFTSFPLLF